MIPGQPFKQVDHMPDEDSSYPYDPAAIRVLEGLDPVSERGVTASYDDVFSEAQVMPFVDALMADKSLWYVCVHDGNGRKMLIYRDPHP